MNDEFAVEIAGGATVGGDDFDFVADFDFSRRIVWQLDGAVFFGVEAGDFCAAAIDYRHYERFGYALYALGIVLLLLVFILGRDIRGSSRWINIGSFNRKVELNAHLRTVKAEVEALTSGKAL